MSVGWLFGWMVDVQTIANKFALCNFSLIENGFLAIEQMNMSEREEFQAMSEREEFQSDER